MREPGALVGRLAGTLAVAAAGAAVAAPPPVEKLSGAHDGRWSVVLACPDVKSDKGLVKGYEYSFTATIAGGVLDGRHEPPGAGLHVDFKGRVAPDGTLEIQASGTTGPSGFSVGRVAQGTPYAFSMQGRLDAASGQAVRRELRPCTATLVRR